MAHCFFIGFFLHIEMHLKQSMLQSRNCCVEKRNEKISASSLQLKFEKTISQQKKQIYLALQDGHNISHL